MAPPLDVEEFGRWHRQADSASEITWPDVGDRAVRLSRHYISSRHPDAHPGKDVSAGYTAADADQAGADASAITAAVDSTWTALAATGL